MIRVPRDAHSASAHRLLQFLLKTEKEVPGTRKLRSECISQLPVGILPAIGYITKNKNTYNALILGIEDDGTLYLFAPSWRRKVRIEVCAPELVERLLDGLSLLVHFDEAAQISASVLALITCNRALSTSQRVVHEVKRIVLQGTVLYSRKRGQDVTQRCVDKVNDFLAASQKLVVPPIFTCTTILSQFDSPGETPSPAPTPLTSTPPSHSPPSQSSQSSQSSHSSHSPPSHSPPSSPLAPPPLPTDAELMALAKKREWHKLDTMLKRKSSLECLYVEHAPAASTEMELMALAEAGDWLKLEILLRRNRPLEHLHAEHTRWQHVKQRLRHPEASSPVRQTPAWRQP
jgi:hypothetical protein